LNWRLNQTVGNLPQATFFAVRPRWNSNKFTRRRALVLADTKYNHSPAAVDHGCNVFGELFFGGLVPAIWKALLPIQISLLDHPSRDRVPEDIESDGRGFEAKFTM
jgi:hypothetical protein